MTSKLSEKDSMRSEVDLTSKRPVPLMRDCNSGEKIKEKTIATGYKPSVRKSLGNVFCLKFPLFGTMTPSIQQF